MAPEDGWNSGHARRVSLPLAPGKDEGGTNGPL